ncbi:MAG: DUF3106 domain-containing protein [Polaromonas sp.]|nr:DUF3106 domain-containing protein [Polaromonas sp.]
MSVFHLRPKPSALPPTARRRSLHGLAKNTLLPTLSALLLLLSAQAASSQSPTAQPVEPPSRTAAAAAKTANPKANPKVPVSRPVWAQLTVQQQIALRPLAEIWDPLSEAQKRKWLELSKTFPSLPAEDQDRMHSRMVEWVAMSPQQRAQARLNFAKTRELATDLTADEKKAKWQSYLALSAEEKQKLAEMATQKPTGAATAITPVARQKLTAVSAPLEPRANRTETRVTPLQPTPAK